MCTRPSCVKMYASGDNSIFKQNISQHVLAELSSTCKSVPLYKKKRWQYDIFISKLHFSSSPLSFELNPVFWGQAMVCFLFFSLDTVNLCPLCVSLPGSQSVELAFDETWKAHGSGGECWARTGERVGMGVGLAGFRRKRLMGGEVKQGGGQQEFGKDCCWMN